MKLAIVIPAYNESSTIRSVLKSLPKKIDKISEIRIVVVDDGSTDDTFKKAAVKKITILRHLINRGAGAATRTGIEYVKKINSDIVVTFDADGQHSPKDVEKILKPIIRKEADMVVGSRLIKLRGMPTDRFLLNWLANLATFILFGVFSTDSQSGLRALSKKAINTIDFKNDKMEFSSEILWEAKRNDLKIKEVPTSTIYSTYSRKKGQKNLNALPVFLKFLMRFLR